MQTRPRSFSQCANCGAQCRRGARDCGPRLVFAFPPAPCGGRRRHTFALATFCPRFRTAACALRPQPPGICRRKRRNGEAKRGGGNWQPEYGDGSKKTGAGRVRSAANANSPPRRLRPLRGARQCALLTLFPLFIKNRNSSVYIRDRRGAGFRARLFRRAGAKFRAGIYAPQKPAVQEQTRVRAV